MEGLELELPEIGLSLELGALILAAVGAVATWLNHRQRKARRQQHQRHYQELKAQNERHHRERMSGRERHQ